MMARDRCPRQPTSSPRKCFGRQHRGSCGPCENSRNPTQLTRSGGENVRRFRGERPTHRLIAKNISSASERPNTAPPPSQNDTKSVSPAGGGAEPLCHRLVLRRRSTFSILLVAARTAASPTPAHATNKGVTPVTGMASSAPPQIAAMATATPWSTSVFLFTRCGSSAVVA